MEQQIPIASSCQFCEKLKLHYSPDSQNGRKPPICYICHVRNRCLHLNIIGRCRKGSCIHAYIPPVRIADADRSCNVCHITKSIDCFGISIDRKEMTNPCCKACVNKKAAEYRAKVPYSAEKRKLQYDKAKERKALIAQELNFISARLTALQMN